METKECWEIELIHISLQIVIFVASRSSLGVQFNGRVLVQ